MTVCVFTGCYITPYGLFLGREQLLPGVVVVFVSEVVRQPVKTHCSQQRKQILLKIFLYLSLLQRVDFSPDLITADCHTETKL